MTGPTQRPTPETDAFLIEGGNYSYAGLADFARRLERERDEAWEKLAEHESSFKLRWAADMRAIKRWQAEAPGRELTWPDHADLCVWLLSERDALRSRYDVLAHAVWHALDDSEEDASSGTTTITKEHYETLCKLVPEDFHETRTLLVEAT